MGKEVKSIQKEVKNLHGIKVQKHKKNEGERAKGKKINRGWEWPKRTKETARIQGCEQQRAQDKQSEKLVP